MKLISKFSDYYDYNIGLYGIDEKVVYNRLPLQDTVIQKSDLKYTPPRANPFGRYSINDEWEYVRLLFCGRYLPLRKKRNEYKSQYELITPELLEEIINNQYRKYWNTVYEVDYKKQYNFVNEIHKLTKHPVLILNGELRGEYIFDTNIPILNNIKGFVSLVDAKQAYLDITQCIIDINNTEGAPAMADTDKIVSHGFDKKISFRHRK